MAHDPPSPPPAANGPAVPEGDEVGVARPPAEQPRELSADEGLEGEDAEGEDGEEDAEAEGPDPLDAPVPEPPPPSDAKEPEPVPAVLWESESDHLDASVPQAAASAEAEIDPAALDIDAVKVVNRLHQNGHQAYLVGGCVRDLLLGRKPKDFDIATCARPSEVRGSSATAASSAAASASPTSTSGTGRSSRSPPSAPTPSSELDPTERADGRGAPGRPAHPGGQRLRHRRAGRAPPGLHHQRPLLRRGRGAGASTTSRAAATSPSVWCAPSATPNAGCARTRFASCER